MGRHLAVAIALFIGVMLASPAIVEEKRPKFPSDETVNVPSHTFTNEQFLAGAAADGVPVTLTGELRFPSWDERLPAVVLLHGSDGHGSGSTLGWREFLNKIGIATLRLDSFGGRGLIEVETDQSRLSLFAQVYDSYRAVDVLAAHPRIDPSRIAVMGFSRGGIAALYGSMRRFQDLYGPTKARIAAHFPFYPACAIQLVGELDVTDAPIREFHGSADDWTPAAPCRAYIERLRAAGSDVVMTEYPDALHSFDNRSVGRKVVVSQSQTTRNCRRREEGGTIVNIETGKPFTYDDACVELGPSVGYDKTATEAAQAAVADFLTEVFRLGGN